MIKGRVNKPKHQPLLGVSARSNPLYCIVKSIGNNMQGDTLKIVLLCPALFYFMGLKSKEDSDSW